jgi:hypothetical protein
MSLDLFNKLLHKVSEQFELFQWVSNRFSKIFAKRGSCLGCNILVSSNFDIRANIEAALTFIQLRKSKFEIGLNRNNNYLISGSHPKNSLPSVKRLSTRAAQLSKDIHNYNSFNTEVSGANQNFSERYSSSIQIQYQKTDFPTKR